MEDGNTSDLYIYESVYDCVTIHVANRRRVGIQDAPHPPSIKSCSVEEWLEHEQVYRSWLEMHEDFQVIGLPHDGASFDFKDPDELKQVLDLLREEGYRFPDHVFELLEEYRKEILLEEEDRSK